MTAMEGRVDRSWQVDLPGENEQVGEQIGGNEERRERKEHELGEKNAPEDRRIAELLEPEELLQKLRRARQGEVQQWPSRAGKHALPKDSAECSGRSDGGVHIVQHISRWCAGAILGHPMLSSRHS